jgi:proteasome lid subunit RPN8/RPN11
MKQLAKGVLEHTFEHLRNCGGGRRECVVYLTGPLDEPNIVDGLVHPLHTASSAGYDLDSDAIAQLWLELAHERRSIRVQVHTHPGSAYHSSRDDRLALIHTPGFLSLVVPNFALGPVGLTGSYLAERTESGDWVVVVPSERLELS